MSVRSLRSVVRRIIRPPSVAARGMVAFMHVRQRLSTKVESYEVTWEICNLHAKQGFFDASMVCQLRYGKCLSTKMLN